MNDNEFIDLKRDCDGFLIPSGDSITLKKGTKVKITQSLGGDFTLYVNGNLVKISGIDADAIGHKNENKTKKEITEFNEKYIWDVLKTCYDPEIPVNIVDLGLIYNMDCKKTNANSYIINIKMTLTSPGCGMGPVIAQDVETKTKNISFVEDVIVEVVWDPLWNQDMMTEEAKLQLGML
jgi:probable FeS assembly SUF system protein SufT